MIEFNDLSQILWTFQNRFEVETLINLKKTNRLWNDTLHIRDEVKLIKTFENIANIVKECYPQYTRKTIDRFEYNLNIIQNILPELNEAVPLKTSISLKDLDYYRRIVHEEYLEIDHEKHPAWEKLKIVNEQIVFPFCMSDFMRVFLNDYNVHFVRKIKTFKKMKSTVDSFFLTLWFHMFH